MPSDEMLQYLAISFHSSKRKLGKIVLQVLKGLNSRIFKNLNFS